MICLNSAGSHVWFEAVFTVTVYFHKSTNHQTALLHSWSFGVYATPSNSQPSSRTVRLISHVKRASTRHQVLQQESTSEDTRTEAHRLHKANELLYLFSPRTGVALRWKSQSRNMRSRCRCSMYLQFALSNAASCALHRPMCRVIHRSE